MFYLLLLIINSKLTTIIVFPEQFDFIKVNEEQNTDLFSEL